VQGDALNRIVYDHQVFASQRHGGISRYVCEIAARIGRMPGFCTRVVAPLAFNAYLPQSGVSRIGIDLPGGRERYPGCLQVSGLLARPIIRACRPDLVHETYYAPRRIAPRGVPTVLTVYDMVYERLPGMFPRQDRVVRDKAVAARRADHVLCISESTRRDLLEFVPLEASRVSVIPLGFSALEDGGVPRRPAPPGGRPYMLFVGKRGGYKNFRRTLQAYAASARLRGQFDLLAFGGGPLTAEENRFALSLGLPQGMPRQVSGDDTALAACYRGARAFVYPSLYEGFGIPPLEAMSLDCPVACSATSSLPEVVGDAALTFDPADVDAQRASMEKIAFDDALRAELIARGRERIKVFTWERCAQQTAQIYEALIGTARLQA